MTTTNFNIYIQIANHYYATIQSFPIITIESVDNDFPFIHQLLHIRTMRMAPLTHYFPVAAIRSLRKSKYQLIGDKVFSDEEKILHHTVVAFRNADKKSRLNSDNYHSMMKLMLQMEDEAESVQCLAYDQENQHIEHVREDVYSLKVVSFCSSFFLCTGHRNHSFLCRPIRFWKRQLQNIHGSG